MRCLERMGRVSTIAKDSGPTQLSVAEKTWQIVEDLLFAFCRFVLPLVLSSQMTAPPPFPARPPLIKAGLPTLV